MNSEPRSLGDHLPGFVEHLTNEADADMPRFEVVRTGDRQPIRSLGVASGPGARCDHTSPIGVS